MGLLINSNLSRYLKFCKFQIPAWFDESFEQLDKKYGKDQVEIQNLFYIKSFLFDIFCIIDKNENVSKFI